MFRAVAGALLIAVLSLSALVSARSRERLFFRVQLETGKVRQLSHLPEAPDGLPWPPVPTDEHRRISTRNGTLILLEQDPGRPYTSKIAWQHTVETGNGWFPWHVLQQNIVTFMWREQIGGQPGQYREVIRALDLESRQVLWSRVASLTEQPGAGALGQHHVLINEASQVVLLETKTGKQIRTFPKHDRFFAVSRPAPGRIWLEAGERIECLEEGTTNTIWGLNKHGALLWLLPIPKSDHWLIKTSTHAYRVNPSDGLVVWSAEARSSARPLLWEKRSYEVFLEDRDWPHLILVTRDLQNGKVLRRYTVGRYRDFFDEARVKVVAARNGSVDVSGDFIVLE